jgi:hypothetical protein
MKRHRFAAAVALVALTILRLAGPVSAYEQVPFKGSFEGERTERIWLTPTTALDRWDMAGTATHLGEFELVVLVVVDFGTVPPTAAGTATFVAANGDQLFADATGHSEPVEPGVIRIIESGVITGGTGRFSGATGSYISQRLTSLVTNETTGMFEGAISSPDS